MSLLRFPGETGYPTFAPILYRDGQVGLNNLFRGDSLDKILLVTIYGPAVLTTGRKICQTDSPFHKVQKITPGSIAWAGIASCYGISPDIEFSPVGGITKINYDEDFHKYKKILIMGKDTLVMKELFQYFQHEIF
ncbi:hypothetical protein BDZ94DRAFT_1176021, partial [Collybia nuda]